jgi:kynurenine formamidase
MKWKTFVIGWGLALSLLLFAQRRSPYPEATVFSTILDLTHSVSADAPNWEGTSPSLHARTTGTLERDGYFTRHVSFDEHSATHMDAPAHMIPGTWTVDQIPAERLVRPLVVLDVTAQARANPDYQVSVEDIAHWESKHGDIPLGSVVLAHTGWDLRWNSSTEFRNADKSGTLHFPGFSLEAARFLVEARAIVGLGIDTLSVDPGISTDYAVHKYCAARGVYHLENVANLGQVPPSGAIAAVTPMKLEGGSAAPVRILAMLK